MNELQPTVRRLLPLLHGKHESSRTAGRKKAMTPFTTANSYGAVHPRRPNTSRLSGQNPRTFNIPKIARSHYKISHGLRQMTIGPKPVHVSNSMDKTGDDKRTEQQCFSLHRVPLLKPDFSLGPSFRRTRRPVVVTNKRPMGASKNGQSAGHNVALLKIIKIMRSPRASNPPPMSESP